MTNAELIAKIKAEIEKRIWREREVKDRYDSNTSSFVDGSIDALDGLLSFLSTIESETTYDTQQYSPRPSVGIEDVARVQFASHAKVFDKKRKAVFDWEQFKEVAGIFYGFGKKDSSNTIESKKPITPITVTVLDKDLNPIEITADDKEKVKQSGSSKVPKDLEEASEEWAKENYGVNYMDFGFTQDAAFRAMYHFRAGAKWQYQKDRGEFAKIKAKTWCEGFDACKEQMPLPEDTVLFNKGVEEGKRLAEEEQADLFTIVALDAAQRAKEQMMKEGLDAVKSGQSNKIEKTIAGVFVKYGMDRQKEQMMKEAVEGEVVQDLKGVNRVKSFGKIPEGLHFGDKVRIIICKKED